MARVPQPRPNVGVPPILFIVGALRARRMVHYSLASFRACTFHEPEDYQVVPFSFSGIVNLWR